MAGKLLVSWHNPFRSSDMAERIITDGRGQRWDVRAPDGAQDVVFRHQSGRELHGELPRALDALSTDELLEALDQARSRAGLPEVGHGELDVAFDQDGYETGR
jgi:hypothetical protein